MTDITPNPYVGPRCFTAADRQRFFGREAEAADLRARVLSERLLLFYAQSGAGKSSLINARLIPRLREEEGFSVLPVGRVAGQLPEGAGAVDNIFLFNLMTSLVHTESPSAPAALAALSLSEFLEHLVTDDGLAWRYDPSATEEPDPGKDADTAARFALIIDQFEEIITGHPEAWAQRKDFFRQLNQALLDHPNLWVVLSLREDHLAALDPFAPLMFNRLRARFYMERMEEAAALEAIRKPAELGGRPFAPGVAERLADDLRRVRRPGPYQVRAEEAKPAALGQYVEPVQLQVVCYQLWEKIKSRPKGPITGEDLVKYANVAEALADYYEQVLAEVEAAPDIHVSVGQLRNWFANRLITELGTRGLVQQVGKFTGDLPNAAVSLLEKKFLVRRDARAGGVWYELTHDTFIDPILASNRRWQEAQRPPTILSFDASPLTTSPHANVQLSWQVQNAELVRLEPIGVTSEHLEGTYDVRPETTTTYVLTAERSGVPAVARQTRQVIVAGRDLTGIQHELSRRIREGHFSALVGPDIDRAVFPFMPAAEAEEWAAAALTGAGAPLWVRYLDFMQEHLVKDAGAQDQAPPAPAGRGQSTGGAHAASPSVSELANQLGYLDRHPDRRRLLDTLAALPASVYVTTSFHTLLEDALRRANKQPETEVCRWLPGPDPGAGKPFGYPPNYEPTVQRPAVFHLYGLDLWPETLALTEDDYVTFLIQVREERERIPLVVRYALARYYNALIGFDPQAWSFKALYHGLIVGGSQRRTGSILQVDSPLERNEAEVKFLEAAFAKHGVDIFWGTTAGFLGWIAQAAQTADDAWRNLTELQILLRSITGDEGEEVAV